MDSREVPPPSQLHPLSSAMLMGHTSYHSARDPSAMIPSNSTSSSIYHSSPGVRLPFGSLAPHQHQYQHHQHQHPHHQHQQHQHQPQNQQQQQQQQSPPPMTTQHQEPKTLESLRFDGSPSSAQSSMRFGSVEQQQQTKKKRGRPRKYAAEGNIALALAPTTQLPSASNSYGGGGEVAASGGGGGGGPIEANSSDPPAKRNRGRPPGSGKKQLDALGGTGGVGFTPHVIEVKAGEDIASKITSFSQQGPRTICVLSACGSISNVTLQQQAMSSGTVTYEGRFEIVSLSGSFLHSENNGSINKSGSLSVSLAGPEGRLFGGGVAGKLVAGSPVQVIIGSFITERKKQKSNGNQVVNMEPSSAPPNLLTFGASGTPASPHSQGPSSESSEGNDSANGSHRLNHQPQQQQQQQLHHPGNYRNSTQPLQPMPMYQHLWTGHSPQ